MYCPKCRFETAAGSRFCPSCGATLGNTSTSRLKPLVLYSLNGALLFGFVAWLAKRNGNEIIAAAIAGVVVGLIVASIGVASRALRGK